jgi:hypothetical protein
MAAPFGQLRTTPGEVCPAPSGRRRADRGAEDVGGGRGSARRRDRDDADRGLSGAAARQGVRYWAVGVVENNADATRLYERVGFRPFYRQLLAEV